jgi:hypothetical protein
LSYEKAVILHKVLTELHIGMLFLATIAAVAAVFSWRRLRRQGIAQISDGTFIGATICGTVFLVLSAVTGFLAWPWDRLWRTPMIYSKVTYFTLGLNFWLILLWFRNARNTSVGNASISAHAWIRGTRIHRHHDGSFGRRTSGAWGKPIGPAFSRIGSL